MNKPFLDSEAETLALDNCDREPIHIPGTIQPFGSLIAGSIGLDRIEYAGANLEAFTGITPQEALGQPFSALFDVQTIHDIRNALSLSTARVQRERVGRRRVGEQDVEVFVHLHENAAIVELERADDALSSGFGLNAARALLARINEQHSIERMLRAAVTGLQALTGYDRVKAYVFEAGGEGEVVAEAVNPGAPSLMGQRFPAWDIPKQARALMLKTPIRMLVDVNQTPVPIETETRHTPPLDLSLAHLRGISPIHVEYLKNMGVAGTLNLAIGVRDELWGMIAFHHLEPKVLDPETRSVCELFSQMFSLILQQQIEKEMLKARERAGEARRQMLAETNAMNDLVGSFREIAPILQELVACDGLAVVNEDQLQSQGDVPSAAVIHALSNIKVDEFDLIEPIQNLGAHPAIAGVGDLKTTAGAMIVRATSAYPLQLIFFRNEVLDEVTWAGRPEKSITVGEFGHRLSPRGSFEAYRQQVKGTATPWSNEDKAAAGAMQVTLTQITARSERAMLDRQKDLLSYQRQQDLMIAELNHRVKNILSLIRSLSRQAMQSSASMEAYATALEQRITALAAAHDLAVYSTMDGVPLRALIETELTPYRATGSAQVLIDGPTVGLRADVAPMIALVIHELVTNANKYGALSNDEGLVRVSWREDESGLHFNWREVGGPSVSPPERKGFGRSLIERAIPYEFDGTVEMDFAPAGVRLGFFLPTGTLAEVDETVSLKPSLPARDVSNEAASKVALLVEDNAILAMDMQDTLDKIGFGKVETVGTIAAALALLEKKRFDLAVLDMNLRGEVSYDIAETLLEKAIPFIFVTGYGSHFDMPSHLAHITILSKPVNEATLSNALAGMLG
ncbi:MAG: HWE histidine kinase domain-containing protein [Pseudomonadota bacterium]